jgi:hypothetical protein
MRNERGGMTTSTQMAEALLRHLMLRSELLAPLGSISETCWMIMLQIYAERGRAPYTLSALARDVDMPITRISRYTCVLKTKAFIEQDDMPEILALSEHALHSIDHILNSVIQDLLFSLGKRS